MHHHKAICYVCYSLLFGKFINRPINWFNSGRSTLRVKMFFENKIEIRVDLSEEGKYH